MPPRCPYCQVYLAELAPAAAGQGERACPQCRKTFEYYAIVRPRRLMAPQAAAPGALHNAANLPDMAAFRPKVDAPPIPLPTVDTAEEDARRAARNLPGAVAVLPSAAIIAASACAYHANNQAVTACQQCGSCICNLCFTPQDGRAFCTRCYELLHGAGVLTVTQRNFSTHNLAFNLALGTLLLGWFYGAGILMGPFAIFYSFKALGAIKQRPELPGKGKATAALVIASLGLVIWLGGLAVVLYFFGQEIAKG